MKLKIVSWNLHQESLINYASLTKNFDVGLFQEVKYKNETYSGFMAKGESFDGVGTGIFVRSKSISNVKIVKSPHGDFRAKFWKSKVFKTTTIADVAGITFVSFHGFNGTLQGKEPGMLLDHVSAVLARLLTDGPIVFAGDFNTWTPKHIDMVTKLLAGYGFEYAMSAPFDKKKTLDLVFVKLLKVSAMKFEKIKGKSDHPILTFEVEPNGF